MTESSHKNRQFNILQVLAPLVILLLVVVGSLYFIKSRINDSGIQSQEREEIQVGSILPQFSLVSSPGGQSVAITSFSSKVILMNFWATWCEACMEEMPSLVDLRSRFHQDGLEVIGVNLDENPDRTIEKTKGKYKIEFPLFKDPEGKVADLFDVHAIPVTVVFDSSRKVLFIKEGGQDWFSKKSVKLVQEWLKQ